MAANTTTSSSATPKQNESALSLLSTLTLLEDDFTVIIKSLRTYLSSTSTLQKEEIITKMSQMFPVSAQRMKRITGNSHYNNRPKRKRSQSSGNTTQSNTLPTSETSNTASTNTTKSARNLPVRLTRGRPLQTYPRLSTTGSGMSSPKTSPDRSRSSSWDLLDLERQAGQDLSGPTSI